MTSAPLSAAPPRVPRRHPGWRWLAGAFTAAVVAVIGWLLLRQAREVDWPGVWQALRALPRGTLALGALLAWASHLAYGCFDLFGRHVLAHGLSVPRTMGVTLTAYPFALNLGSIIGGVSVRWRLYSRQGLSPGQIGQVIVLSIITNWLGYCVLICGVFWAWAPPLPPGWEIGPGQMRALGLGLAAIGVAYLGLCARRGGRPLRVHGRELPLPRTRMALLQLVLSCVNWALMGGALWALARGQVPYAAALAAVLLGAVAGLLSRIPAGLGVIEAVGIAVLSPWMPPSQALAVVLAYRALYYFAPLAAAGIALLGWEWRGKMQAKSASSAFPSSANSY